MLSLDVLDGIGAVLMGFSSPSTTVENLALWVLLIMSFGCCRELQ